MRNNTLLIASALACSVVFTTPVLHAQTPQRPSDMSINGRMESQSAALNAVVNECAVRTGNLYDALEKAGQEIQKLKAELEAAKKPALGK